MSFSFHPISDNEVLYVSLAYHRASIVPWFRAFPDRPFSESVSLGSTFFVFQKVRVWHHDCVSLLFGKLFAKFEELGVVQVGDQSCDSLLNMMIFCVWLKS